MATTEEDERVSHFGGCHCKAVRFEVEAPRHLVAWDCNCSICSMKRNSHFVVPSNRFRLLQGADALTSYRFNTRTAHHMFCSTCGVTSHYVPRSNPDGVAVTVRCLDPGTVLSVETRDFDGQHWEENLEASGITACSKE